MKKWEARSRQPVDRKTRRRRRRRRKLVTPSERGETMRKNRAIHVKRVRNQQIAGFERRGGASSLVKGRYSRRQGRKKPQGRVVPQHGSGGIVVA